MQRRVRSSRLLVALPLRWRPERWITPPSPSLPCPADLLTIVVWPRHCIIRSACAKLDTSWTPTASNRSRHTLPFPSYISLPPLAVAARPPEWPARANVPAICYPQIHRKHARAGVRTNCLTSQLDNNCAPCCNRCANGCSGDELRRESRWRAAHSVIAVTGVHTAIPAAAKAARGGGKAGNA